MSKNNDGLRYPSIDKLLDKIDSKYKLVYAASKTAHIIDDEDLYLEDAKSQKSIGKALEEILNGKVEVEFK